MSKKPRWMWNLGLIVTASSNYAAANLLIIIWKVELFQYLLTIFILSVIVGTVVSNLYKSIIISFVTMVGGLLIASIIFMAPYIIFAESTTRVNYAMIVFFSFLAKVFLISVALYFMGTTLGCFLSQHVTRRAQAIQD
jgi:hypothetical protein